MTALTVGHQDHRQQEEPQTKCNSSDPAYWSQAIKQWKEAVNM